MNNKISNNPLDYVSQKDIAELGLTSDELSETYQPSKGGVYHARGAESMGKTLWIAHKYRYLIDKGLYLPSEAVGNITFKGKYSLGYQTLKGDDLRQYLWDLTHIPYEHKIVIIDEADSEFPARLFNDKEQTEIALRLWHTAKMHNYILMTSHIGNSVDIIMHLASHFYVFPRQPNFGTNSMDFTLANGLDNRLSNWTAYDIIRTMLIYNRRELTEDTISEQSKIRPSLLKKTKKHKEIEFDLDYEAEIERATQLG